MTWLSSLFSKAGPLGTAAGILIFGFVLAAPGPGGGLIENVSQRDVAWIGFLPIEPTETSQPQATLPGDREIQQLQTAPPTTSVPLATSPPPTATATPESEEPTPTPTEHPTEEPTENPTEAPTDDPCMAEIPPPECE